MDPAVETILPLNAQVLRDPQAALVIFADYIVPPAPGPKDWGDREKQAAWWARRDEVQAKIAIELVEAGAPEGVAIQAAGAFVNCGFHPSRLGTGCEYNVEADMALNAWALAKCVVFAAAQKEAA